MSDELQFVERYQVAAIDKLKFVGHLRTPNARQSNLKLSPQKSPHSTHEISDFVPQLWSSSFRVDYSALPVYVFRAQASNWGRLEL